jgi:hypothetical protein
MLPKGEYLMSELDRLKQLNVEIGEREKAGDGEYFTTLLADDFIFRRANGAIVGKSEYIDGLASVVENPYEQRGERVESVTVNGNSAVVNAIVIVRRRNMERPGEFKNVRVFRQENDDWQLAIWINTKIRDL